MQTPQLVARSWKLRCSLLALLGVAWLAAPSAAQDATEPVVARTPMRFAIGEKVVDQIDKGDLLTVLEDREEHFLVLTFRGKKGLVSKADVASLENAVEIYSQLISEHPEESRLLTLRASAWWARGDQRQALADYDKAIELGLKTPDVFASRALFHASLGHYDQAMADYTKAISLDAHDASLLTNRAAVHMSRQDYKLATADYSKAIELNPNEPAHYQQRAIAWKVQGELEKALADNSKAIELNPAFADAWLARGFLQYRMGRHGDAVADLSQAIQLAPENASAYNNRGYNRQLLGDERDALADYNEAIRLAPEYSLAYLNKAWILAASPDESIRDSQLAIEAAKTACRLTNYENTTALKALAAAFAEDGQFDKAVGWQEKVMKAANEEHHAAEQKILQDYQQEKPFRLPGKKS